MSDPKSNEEPNAELDKKHAKKSASSRDVRKVSLEVSVIRMLVWTICIMYMLSIIEGIMFVVYVGLFPA